MNQKELLYNWKGLNLKVEGDFDGVDFYEVINFLKKKKKITHYWKRYNIFLIITFSEMYPNCTIELQIILTSPVKIAAVDSLFSKWKYIKKLFKINY